jgi:hypothetical protein
MAKTAKGLVEYAKAQLGKPYWYGTFGQAASKVLYNQKKNQYPDYYEWAYGGETEKVHDCVGLIKGYLWCDNPKDNTPVYNRAQDLSANGMRNVCTISGSISSLPDVAGVLVFMNHHVGVYIGNGEVIEARGHAYGVVKTKLVNRAWTHWGYCPYVTYEKNVVINTNHSANINANNSKIDTVVEVQKWLNSNYSSGLNTDNIYGRKTKAALVKALQKEVGFTGKDVDGIYGEKTNAAIKNLRKGSNGALVKVLQALLVCNGYKAAYVDGDFGSGTEISVKDYQQKKRLSVDGIAGKNTFAKLCG